MLVRNSDGNLEEVTPTRQGQESVLAAEARVLVQEVKRIRDNSESAELRTLADAVIRLGQLVYQGR